MSPYPSKRSAQCSGRTQLGGQTRILIPLLQLALWLPEVTSPLISSSCLCEKPDHPTELFGGFEKITRLKHWTVFDIQERSLALTSSLGTLRKFTWTQQEIWNLFLRSTCHYRKKFTTVHFKARNDANVFSAEKCIIYPHNLNCSGIQMCIGS